ncbi:uncharacterized protein TRIADDRAFT_57419 [Trichoplax adhaerens]|uniref:Exocyst component Exo84 C-terminal domain-containing protein n=1 Tax=Trichoplax adhaerens TaxID=10228 RepID=B3RZE2_TRIAD|nr:hypothetical protein TRIADDRAFT_57419 [Trichoplax adhaerens]EDV23828.1 hypothetical protein TRIADDRAFT_57419 [Trichoplax adhaerens]|eukprot:XP_002113354.1 hypothetical protein TRIADDRAFT_57419 [Trichoplax adhaerens]
MRVNCLRQIVVGRSVGWSVVGRACACSGVERERQFAVIDSQSAPPNNDYKVKMDIGFRNLRDILNAENFDAEEYAEDLSASKSSIKEKDKFVKDEQLQQLLDSIEGYKDAEVTSDTHIVTQGNLLEINPDTKQALRNVFMFLLSDRILVTTPLPQRERKNNLKYKLEAEYLFGSFAVVDVLSDSGVKNAFKFLPSEAFYQTGSSEAKSMWLKTIREAMESADSRNMLQAKDDPISSTEININVDFNQQSHASDPTSAEEVTQLFEDLDICVAQRDFEGAATFVIKIHDIIAHRGGTEDKEYKKRLDEITLELSSNLAQELTSFYGSSLPGGTSSVRKAVDILKRLERTSLACQLFMKNRSFATRYKLRQLKIEGAITLYITKLSRAFFNEMIRAAKEFRTSFEDKPECFSSFVIWARGEMKAFVSSFSRQVFRNNLNISVVSECVRVACNYCDELKSVGFDLKFILHRVLLKNILETIFDARDQLIDACKHRAIDEQWRSVNLRKEETAQVLVHEMNNYGIESFQNYIYNGCVILLSESVIAFVKRIMTFLEGCFQFDVCEINAVIVECICDIFKCQIRNMKATLASKQFANEKPFILKNAVFLNHCLLSCIKRKTEAIFGYSFKEFRQLSSFIDSELAINEKANATKSQADYPSLKSGQSASLDEEFDYDDAEFV